MRALFLVLLGCQGSGPAEEAPPPDRGATVEPLVLPDLEGIDFVAAFTDALQLTRTVNTQAPWAGHVTGLELRQEGCPDLWSGAPEEADLMDATGISWADYCDTPGGLYYDGFAYWETAMGVSVDLETVTWEASRTLVADAIVGAPEGVIFELDGTATDSVYRVEAGGETSRWIYSSLVEGTVTGSGAFADDTLTPAGWRTDLYLYLTGGDVDSFEARGNVYLFDGRLHERFDSLAMDLELAGPTGLGPDDCGLEPKGWIGLRDENAYWYDVVFLPVSEDATTDYDNAPLSDCDGCGTLYVRGVASGEVCMDFTFLFDGSFAPPDVADFILTLHDLPE